MTEDSNASDGSDLVNWEEHLRNCIVGILRIGNFVNEWLGNAATAMDNKLLSLHINRGLLDFPNPHKTMCTRFYKSCGLNFNYKYLNQL